MFTSPWIFPQRLCREFLWCNYKSVNDSDSESESRKVWSEAICVLEYEKTNQFFRVSF